MPETPDSLDAFDFDLPDELIALRPARPRDMARMLVVNREAGGSLEDRIVHDLPGLLAPGDVLVVNDTRVIPARLYGERHRDGATARIELLLHKASPTKRQWYAFARPAKRLKAGDVVIITPRLVARVLARHEGEVTVTFEGEDADNDLALAIAASGVMPLPPYIETRRTADARDTEDYQTLFADRDGSVAAPTAGLHFTPELIERLVSRGISIERVTLHVGAGTFLPVKSETLSGHRMHAEWGEVTRATAARLNAARAAGGRIVTVGTTSMRLLESAVDDARLFHPFAGETDIFITPGFSFRAADMLMTNFHLPRSTLFVLVSAFAGCETMKAAYAHAIEENYRFFSYGDATLLFPGAGIAS